MNQNTDVHVRQHDHFMVLLQIGQDLCRWVVQFDVGFGFQTLQLWIVQSQSPEHRQKKSVCIDRPC